MPPAYDENRLLAKSVKEGWRLGLVGIPWPGPWPKRCGDLFVSAPNSELAGIAWEADGPDFLRILGPSEGRWGVFQLRFPIPVMCNDDLVRNFHAVLPLLKAEYAAYQAASDSATR
ncbi:hypothetical protein J2X16_004196 [Pelomonas aquatica]|uniref:Uncharacterized protein n=1 Tax=Pelomonas aquatica TaxID=431058 RepID=A0ABU1ZE28_9BURK|nr:hypothetical protein [Pelomonas aquatica]MDR7298828.1 hypothetical protein [Pelomonas aquatica]